MLRTETPLPPDTAVYDGMVLYIANDAITKTLNTTIPEVVMLPSAGDPRFIGRFKIIVDVSQSAFNPEAGSPGAVSASFQQANIQTQLNYVLNSMSPSVLSGAALVPTS